MNLDPDPGGQKHVDPVDPDPDFNPDLVNFNTFCSSTQGKKYPDPRPAEKR
jgi:hypothetical protein